MTFNTFFQAGKGALWVLLFCLTCNVAQARDWSLKDSSGTRYSLASLKGKWVLVNFWAPWCPSCVQEMSELNALQQQHPELQVIGVAVMYRSKKEVLDLAAVQLVHYPIVLGNEDVASEFGEMKGMPTSFLYSPTGKLIGKHEGALTANEIEQALSQPNAKIFTQ